MIIFRLIFIISLFLLLQIKTIWLLSAIIAILWLLSWKNFYSINKKVIKSIIFFNLIVSLGYIIFGIFKGYIDWKYIIYINEKVYALSYFVSLFFIQIDFVQFFSFSKELSFLLSISLSQIISYKKTFEDFRLAFKTRVIKNVHKYEKDFIAQTLTFFFEKAMFDAKERSLAMKARGFFD